MYVESSRYISMLIIRFDSIDCAIIITVGNFQLWNITSILIIVVIIIQPHTAVRCSCESGCKRGFSKSIWGHKQINFI